MSEWIKARIDLHRDPIVVKQAAALGRTAYEIAYAWIVVWGWARSHTADGFVRDVDQATIDAIVGIPDFAQNAGRWVEIASDGVTFPNWDRHNSNGARERAQANERKAASRSSRHAPVTVMSRSCPENVTVERDKNRTRREEIREEITTTNTNSNSYPLGAECLSAAKADGGGGGGNPDSSKQEGKLQAAAKAMPAYVAPAQRVKLARHALAFAATIDGAEPLDVVGYLDSLATQSSPTAKPGAFVNLLKSGAEGISREDFDKWLADKPRREMLRWLRTDPQGQATWAQAYGQEARRRFPTEQAAMEAYVNIQLGKQADQARGGAA